MAPIFWPLASIRLVRPPKSAFLRGTARAAFQFLPQEERRAQPEASITEWRLAEKAGSVRVATEVPESVRGEEAAGEEKLGPPARSASKGQKVRAEQAARSAKNSPWTWSTQFRHRSRFERIR